MAKIKPTVSVQDMLCIEEPGGPSGLVVFGASGDLAGRKLLPSLYNNFKRGLLSEHFYIVGCGRKQLSDEQFRQLVCKAISGKPKRRFGKKLNSFLQRIYYLCGDYGQRQFYEQIKERLNQLDEIYNCQRCHIFYLAVPPVLYEPITAHLGEASLSCENCRIVVEKPFGTDLKSAVKLNQHIQKFFSERQIYRIDHYLGKETVQNILMFRFANEIFEPIWNHNYIDHIQITIAESLGIEHRGGYYDNSGAVRDMFQNHMLSMLSLVAMEPPVAFESDRIRDQKVSLLRAIRPLEPAGDSPSIIKGQYTAGSISGKRVCGYLDEPDVKSDSKTETYVAAKLFIDNWRWRGTPFYLRTGKRMAEKLTEIAIFFKTAPNSMFSHYGIDVLPANVLVLKIQPEEGIDLSFQAKRPGSKICMSTLKLDFNYREIFGSEPPEAYERLLLDCMIGDQMLFLRQDDIELAWGLLEPVLQSWANGGGQLHLYPAGAESFAAADALIKADGRKWRKFE